MAVDELLARMGYVPQGTIDRSPMGKIQRTINTLYKIMQENQEKEMKKQQDKISMYKTLRDAGYDSQRAYDAVLKGSGFPEPGGQDVKQEKDLAELNKTTAETEKIQKEIVEPKLTDSQKFRENLQQARQGKIEWEDVEQDWPDRSDTITKVKKQLTDKGLLQSSLTKQPIQQVKPLQLIARSKPGFANMNLQTQTQAEKIKTYQDLLNFVKYMDKLEESGVDVEAIQNYYAKEIQELITSGVVGSK